MSTENTQPMKGNYHTVLSNTIALGDSENILTQLLTECIDLIVTSPPYFNAMGYVQYSTYADYLNKMRAIIVLCHNVLKEGRFFAINTSPVIVPRKNRSLSSKRLAIPFDLHSIFIDTGFDFIDDIIWEKPKGAAGKRGTGFSRGRKPLQYKSIPVTEYILVYRKSTNRLIDWNINKHPDQQIVNNSRIAGDYEDTNIWRINPQKDKDHPAVFPLELVENLIKYYSFIDDMILDPFAGVGTTGQAATKLDRRFFLVEQNDDYVKTIKSRARLWLGKNKCHKVKCINCKPIECSDMLI